MSDERLHRKLAELDAELSSEEEESPVRERTSTRTRDNLAAVEAELAKVKIGPSTSTRTRERLAEAERQLALRTSTSTRERLAEIERKLAQETVFRARRPDMDEEQVDSRTSTRTRDRLEEAERQLRLKTSTSTREKLAEAEKRLSRRTNTKTREQLEEAERKLADMKTRTKTSTGTREELRRVEEEIAKERAKATSDYTREVFERKQELLRKMLEKNKNVDVVFLLDCTGSMAGYINEAKNQIKKIAEDISAIYENNMRVAFVGYRDHCDGSSRIEIFQFSEDTDKFVSFLGGVAAKGGGDAPEDVLGGLEAAVNLAWSSASKVIFHVGDAPQHGPRFHDLGAAGDTHYGAEPRGLVAEDLFRSMKQIGVKYFFGKVNNSTDKMFAEFQKIGGKEMVKEVNMSRPDLLDTQAVTSISATIEGTLAATVDMVRSLRVAKGGSHLPALSEVSCKSGKTLKDFSISETEPDDLDETHLEPQRKVHWLTCTINILDNIRDIKEHIGSINHSWSNKMVKKARHPFAEGAQRISYHGMRMNYAEGEEDEKIVLKEFKHTGSERDRRSDYVEIMETQCVAAFMASEFNKVAPAGSKKITFLHVSVVQVHDRDGAARYYNVEKLLPDYSNFKKWNTNFGAVNIDEQLIQAFSHWTYDITGILSQHIPMTLTFVSQMGSWWWLTCRGWSAARSLV